MVKLSQIKYKKNVKTHCFLLRLEVRFEGAQPLATFGNLYGFRVPGNDILALDEVQTVLYTHLVITRFLYRSACLNERQSLPQKPRSQHFNSFSSGMGVANSVVMTCPEMLTHQFKRVLV